MSVTFSPRQSGREITHVMKFWCDTPQRVVTADPLTTKAALTAHDFTCVECISYSGSFYEPTFVVDSINLSNSNAVDLLDVLGLSTSFEDGLFGQIQADDLLGRVLIALSIAPQDLGYESAKVGNVIYSGRSENYIQTRLIQLEAIATFAKSTGCDVIWG